MQYINPYDLLKINPGADVNPENIRKAKRKLLVDFELNGQTSILWQGKQLSKDDIIRISGELESGSENGKAQFYREILEIPELHHFLTHGGEVFFEEFEPHAIYKKVSFQEFVFPYYTYQFDRLIFNKFIKNDFIIFKQIAKNNILKNTKYEIACYRNVSNRLDEMMWFIDKLILKIPEKSQQNNSRQYLSKLKTLIKSKFNTELMNRLPDFFQNQRNELARKFWSLAIAVQNNFHDRYMVYFIICLTAKYLDINGEIRHRIRQHCQKYHHK